MDNKKGDFYYAGKAIENINAISTYIQNITYEEFISNIQLLDAIMFRFVQLIENIKNIGEPFKNLHPEIPWGKIIGFRNGIVHEYGYTNYETVYETAVNDLLPLKAVLEKAI